MQSNNPVFNRNESFHHGHGQTQYTDPSAWGTGAPGDPVAGYNMPSYERMTIDSVVQKTAMSIGVVIIAALATWFVVGDIVTAADAGTLYGALIVGSGGAFILSLVNSFKKVISPALVLAFAALEGVALGALSKAIDLQVSQYVGDNNVVMQAVLGTFAAFAGTLAAYKFLNIQVGNKFRTFVTAAMFGMVGLGLLEMVLSFFGNGMGLFANGALGVVFALAGLVLGVFMLIMDFDFVEQGVANGLEVRESWRAAFAMTVSLVWIYTNLLRLLAIFQQD
ncbi:MAG: Bax inhibitor-1/YccA family protein [Nocardioides sp.]|uniref:Bax inhibitor-1/YccA family protein n=1 Tax=Nocardioides sp. TaxID=35761 RepID=UPI003F0BA2FD